MMSPDSELEGGKVRPKSKVDVVFINSQYHKTPNYAEQIHPELAKKLLEQGKIRMGKKLTDAEKAANKAALEESIKAKGRTPGKPAKEEEDELDELVGGDDKDKGKGKDAKSGK
jgi:hypothetical protein